MTAPALRRGMMLIDEWAAKSADLNPVTFETESALDGFPRTVLERWSARRLV